MMSQPWTGHLKRLILALGVGAILAGSAVAIGLFSHRPVQTVTIVGSSLLFESQPGAALVVALGYPRALGAGVALLANLAPIPIIVTGLDLIVAHWAWARKQVERADKRAAWVRRYGPLMFVPLCPVLGAYASVATGRGLGFRPLSTLSATVAGMLWSVALIVYGGHYVVHLFIR